MSATGKLRELLTPHEKWRLLALTAFSLFISLIETVGISAVLPFIKVASDFEYVRTQYYCRKIYEFVGFEGPSEFVLALGGVLIVFYCIRGVLNLVFVYVSQRFAYGRYHRFANQLFQTYLSIDYRHFVSKNSSVLTKTVVTEASLMTSVLANALLVISETFIILLLYLVLILVNARITLALTALLLLEVVFLTKTVSKWIAKYGILRDRNQETLYKVLSETFGNLKLIKTRPMNKELFARFSGANLDFAKSYTASQTLLAVPRFTLETIGFSILVATVMFVVYQYRAATAVLPIISMYALVLIRILPSFNRILSSYNMIQFLKRAVDIVYADLALPREELGDDRITFDHEIRFESVSFGFDGTDIISEVTLTIRKGEKVAVVGESGAGKSTFIDVFIGLLAPQKGAIKVDGRGLGKENIRSWRGKIGYIPQQIYLFDGTIADNVVFGRDYDEGKIIDVLRRADIYDFLMNNQGIHTPVGENGIMLSGGQKQRIAIARAIYDSPEILVLDEATSAVDTETESRIMDSIYELSKTKTLIICAHRWSAVARCDRVLHVEDGRITAEGSD